MQVSECVCADWGKEKNKKKGSSKRNTLFFSQNAIALHRSLLVGSCCLKWRGPILAYLLLKSRIVHSKYKVISFSARFLHEWKTPLREQRFGYWLLRQDLSNTNRMRPTFKDLDNVKENKKVKGKH